MKYHIILERKESTESLKKGSHTIKRVVEGVIEIKHSTIQNVAKLLLIRGWKIPYCVPMKGNE